jgi:tetratricopeptide (TPR) repeat protein
VSLRPTLRHEDEGIVGEYEAIEAGIRAGNPTAGERLRDVVAARRDARGDHARWGRLCEAAGESGLALTEYQLALRDHPEDVTALSRLATLYEERGEAAKAIECAERWVRFAPGDGEAVVRLLELLLAEEQFARAREVLAGPAGASIAREARGAWEARLRAAAAAEAEEEEAAPLGMPTDADVVRFLHLFSGRENVYARQWAGEKGEGGYSPVREPLTVAVARNHLLGSITVGVYPVRLDNTVTFFALDVDIKKAALARARGSLAEARRVKEAVAAEAERLRAGLEALGIPALLEDSGFKGRHLWVFLEMPEDAAVVRQFGGLFLKAVPVTSPDVQVEFFPKQASAGAGIGNLIKLPIGIHRRTGRRSRLLQPDGLPCQDPYAVLRQQSRLSRETLYAAITALKARQPQPQPTPPPVPGPEEQALGEADHDAIREAFPAPPPTWTAADFETNPEIAHLLRHCPVLAALKTKVDQHRRLTHDEQIVLMHSLGHSGPGVLAVNYLLEACVDVSPTARLQSALAGNPVSCPKIRKRIPHITGSVPCNCRFDFALGHYPNPRLHLLTLNEDTAPEPDRARTPPTWDPAERARSLRVLRIKRQELDLQIGQLESELQRYMESSGLPEIAAGDGALRLVKEEGAPPALVWHSTTTREGEGRTEAELKTDG